MSTASPPCCRRLNIINRFCMTPKIETPVWESTCREKSIRWNPSDFLSDEHFVTKLFFEFLSDFLSDERFVARIFIRFFIRIFIRFFIRIFIRISIRISIRLFVRFEIHPIFYPMSILSRDVLSDFHRMENRMDFSRQVLSQTPSATRNPFQ